MEHTENYQLPQWVESDRILMEDFNQAMAAIDSGLKAAKDAADGGAAAAEAAQTTADQAKSSAQQAQATADEAEEKADAITAAAYTPENKPFTAGSYTGNGGTQTIQLGFKPSFLIVCGGMAGPYTATSATFIGTSAEMNEITISNNSFTVKNGTYGSTGLWLNYEGTLYSYIAFR